MIDQKFRQHLCRAFIIFVALSVVINIGQMITYNHAVDNGSDPIAYIELNAHQDHQ